MHKQQTATEGKKAPPCRMGPATSPEELVLAQTPRSARLKKIEPMFHNKPLPRGNGNR